MGDSTQIGYFHSWNFFFKKLDNSNENRKLINPILKNTYKKYKMKKLSSKSITPIQKYRKMATSILQKNIK